MGLRLADAIPSRLYVGGESISKVMLGDVQVWPDPGTSTGLWTPADIGATLADWFDASDTSTITLNGNTVSEWRGKVAGLQLTNSDAASQPEYDSGNQTIRFIGKALNAPYPAGLTFKSVFFIMEMPREQPPSGTTAYIIDRNKFAANESNPDAKFYYTFGVGNPTPGRIDGVAYANFDYSAAAANSFKVASHHGSWWVELHASYTFHSFGKASNGNLSFQQIVFLSEIPSLDVVQKLEGWGMHKCGLQASLPADHPYAARMPAPST